MTNKFYSPAFACRQLLDASAQSQTVIADRDPSSRHLAKYRVAGSGDVCGNAIECANSRGWFTFWVNAA
jgi:hypothetical protein